MLLAVIGVDVSLKGSAWSSGVRWLSSGSQRRASNGSAAIATLSQIAELASGTLRNAATAPTATPQVTVTATGCWINVKVLAGKKLTKLLAKRISKTEILIQDIQSGGESRNQGYGSLAMQRLISYAKKNGFNLITGKLSPVDWEHIDRLERFFLKYGFVVELNHADKNGLITLRI